MLIKYGRNLIRENLLCGSYVELRFATIYLNLIDSVDLNFSLKFNSCSVSHKLPNILYFIIVFTTGSHLSLFNAT